MIRHPRKLAPQPPLPQHVSAETLARKHIRTVNLLTCVYHSREHRGRTGRVWVEMIDLANPDNVERAPVPHIRDLYDSIDVTGEMMEGRETSGKNIITQARNRGETHKFAAWYYIVRHLNNGRDPAVTPHVSSIRISDDAIEKMDEFGTGWSTWIHTIITVTPDKPTA